MVDRKLRAQLSELSRELHARGFVANHEGNLTARLAGGRYLVTPTAVSKRLIDSESLLVVDAGGKVEKGRGRPFSELGLHLAVYAARPEVGCVIHAHPPTATGYSVAGRHLDQPMVAEAVVSMGAGIPTVPFAAPGPAAAQALSPHLAGHDAVLLANHGVMAWGADPEQAYLRLEHVEHLARIALVAQLLGGVQPLPQESIPALLESRKKAFGYTGAEANATQGGAQPVPASTLPAPSPDLARIIAEELANALK